MDKLASRNKGKVAGAYMIMYLLLMLYYSWRSLRYIITYGDSLYQLYENPLYHTLNAISNITISAACIVIIVCAFLNKNNLVLFIASVVYLIGDRLIFILNRLGVDVRVSGEFSLMGAIYILGVVSVVVVIAFSVFKLNKAVKYTWYLPAVFKGITFSSYMISCFGDENGGALAMLANISMVLLNRNFIFIIAFLYLGLWLKAKAEEEAPAIGYGF